NQENRTGRDSTPGSNKRPPAINHEKLPCEVVGKHRRKPEPLRRPYVGDNRRLKGAPRELAVSKELASASNVDASRKLGRRQPVARPLSHKTSIAAGKPTY